MSKYQLGEFEEIVLFTVAILVGEACGGDHRRNRETSEEKGEPGRYADLPSSSEEKGSSPRNWAKQ